MKYGGHDEARGLRQDEEASAALDPIIAILWGVQLVVVAVFALRDAIKRRGAESTGLLLGLAIGNLPFFIGLGPAAFLPAFVLQLPRRLH